MDMNHSHLADDQLAALALGHTSSEFIAHLEMCDVCRAEASVYRSILQSTQEVFCEDPVPVNVLRCEQNLWVENSSCEVNDLVHQLRISLTRLDGQLLGQLTADLGGCTCWHDAPVRLFDGQGLVSSSQVSPEGFFSLAIPDPGTALQPGAGIAARGCSGTADYRADRQRIAGSGNCSQINRPPVFGAACSVIR